MIVTIKVEERGDETKFVSNDKKVGSIYKMSDRWFSFGTYNMTGSAKTYTKAVSEVKENISKDLERFGLDVEFIR